MRGPDGLRSPDLPGTVCELLIIDGVPRPLDTAERREAIALADSLAQPAREIQRIEKGMGRSVRDTEDTPPSSC